MKYLLITTLVAFLSIPSVPTVSATTQKKSQTTVKTIKKSTKKTVTPTKKNPTKNTSCDPNYSGCVPIARDVDCAGGKGDGPAYVNGPIYVIGLDIYGLDRNKDGIACE